MQLRELCEKLGLPISIVDEVINFDKDFQYEDIIFAMDKIFSRETWDEGRKEIVEAVGEDKHGIKILACMLRAALKTYDKYIELGIDEEIYIDSLKCFTRFINEHYISYGIYAFDRDWWTSRQLAMKLFRIGELEYEMKAIEGEDVISIHIPSDAIITEDKLRKSYIRAKDFFNKYYPNYKYKNMVCHSWLLSPNLNKVLNNTSNILLFQKSFVITRVDIDEKEYMEWIFKNPNITIDDLPEETTLQRNLKKYLLKGYKLGQAFGYLISNPFLD